MSLFALFVFALYNGPVQTWGFGEIIVLIGGVAIVFAVLKGCGITLPGWFWQIVGIVFLVLFAMWALRMIGLA